MKILKKRQYHQDTYYQLLFGYVDEPNAGFSFPCDENGMVDESKLTTTARHNYQSCLDGNVRILKDAQYDHEYNLIPGSGKSVLAPVVNQGIVQFTNNYWEPAIGECVRCGEEVSLHGFTNTCECGADYNGSGQLLAHRSQWGEETGESLSDILSIDCATTDQL